MRLQNLNSAKIISPIFLIIFSSSFLFSQNVDSTQFNYDQNPNNIIFKEEMINTYPLRQTSDYLKLLPGVVEYNGNFHINGSRNDEIDFVLDGLSIRDAMTGQQFIPIPKQAIKSIGINDFSSSISDGNYGSGSIVYSLKNGSNKFDFRLEHSNDNLGFNSTDDFYKGKNRLGAFWYGYNETNLSASGPILDNKLNFYANVNYQYYRDRNPQLYTGANNLNIFDVQYPEYSFILDMPKGIVFGNSKESYNLFTNLNYSKDNLEITATGIYDHQLLDAPRDHVRDYFNKRLGVIEEQTTYLSIAVKHKISNTFWYNLSGSYGYKSDEIYDEYLKDNFWAYGDSVANAEAGVHWERTQRQLDLWSAQNLGPDDTRFIEVENYNLNGYTFSGSNSIPVNYSKKSQSNYSFNADFNYKINKNNILTFGWNIFQSQIREWNTFEQQQNFARTLFNSKNNNPNGDEKEFKISLLRNAGVNNVGYTILGNKINDGFYKSPKPQFARVFLANSYKKDNLLINFGLDFFRFDLDNQLFTDASNIYQSINFDSLYPEPLNNGYKKSPIHTKINPKFSIQYSFTNKHTISFIYNRTSSVPKLNGVYKSVDNFYRFILFAPSFYHSEDTYDNDIKPVQTSNIVIKFQHRLPLLYYDLTLYYKDIQSQTLHYKITNSDLSSSGYEFWTIKNDASSNIYGLVLSACSERFMGFALNANISLQKAEGTISNILRDFENSNYFVLNVDAPLSYEYSFYSMLGINYLFDKTFSNWIKGTNISALLEISSGHPYTIGTGGGNIDTNPWTRSIDFKDVNAYTTPSKFQMNLKIEKPIQIYKQLSLDLYFYVINLFNSRNIEDVFLRTGSAADDGYEIEDNYIELYGEQYRILHELINIQYNPKNAQQTLFGEPRQIIMGIKLNL